MSIDGPGVLASDLAHDAYRLVIDPYDAGVTLADIAARLHAFEAELWGPLDLELFLAATTQAWWEIGHLDPAWRQRLAELLVSGLSLAEWARDGDGALARARQGVLKRLLARTAIPRARPRPRKRYPTVHRLLLAPGTCLDWLVDGDCFRAVVGKVSQRRGRCEYALFVMAADTESTLASFRAGACLGHRVPWLGQGTVPGPHVIRIDHLMLVREGNPFRLIGALPVDPERFIFGSFGGVLTLADVADDFRRTLARYRGAQSRLQLAELLSD